MLLEVKNLDAGYGFLQILRKVSLNIDAGEYVCLVGPNGAGKSTTLKSIAGLIKPKGGEIFLAGQASCGDYDRYIFIFEPWVMNRFFSQSVDRRGDNRVAYDGHLPGGQGSYLQDVPGDPI